MEVIVYEIGLIATLLLMTEIELKTRTYIALLWPILTVDFVRRRLWK